MPIIGMTFTSIKAYSEEKNMTGDPVDVNSAPNIKEIKRKDIKVPGVKDVLAIDFEFVTRYEPRIGEIIIEGEVLYQTEDAKNVLAMWKDKRLETKFAVDVLNAIFRKCVAKAVQIADELRLPPPLTFPTVKAEEKGTAGVAEQPEEPTLTKKDAKGVAS